MLRRLLFSAAVAALAPALLSGCPSEPYFGDGPELSSAEPAWENGNLGGGHMTAWVEDLAELTDEEEDLLEPYIVTVSGSFGDCVGEPLVQFGSRAATFLAGRADSLQVLAPPGPVGGGKVDISVTCDFGASVLPAAYDYVLGAAADAPGRRVSSPGTVCWVSSESRDPR